MMAGDAQKGYDAILALPERRLNSGASRKMVNIFSLKKRDVLKFSVKKFPVLFQLNNPPRF